MKMCGVVIVGVLVAMGAGCATGARGASERAAFEHALSVYAAHLEVCLPVCYELCAGTDEGTDRDACLEVVESKARSSVRLLRDARRACDLGDAAFLQDRLDRLRGLWDKAGDGVSEGRYFNSWVVLGRSDWVALDTTLGRAPWSPGHEGEAHRYVVPPGAYFDACVGMVLRNILLRGAIALTPTGGAFPEQGEAVVAIPTDLSLTMSARGRTLRFWLEQGHAANALRVDASGKGTLGVVMTSDSDSIELIGLVYVGTTLYFEFPVEVDPQWRWVRLVVPRSRPGSELIPTTELAMSARDGGDLAIPPRGVHPLDDIDGNGVRDGADWYIAMIRAAVAGPGR